MVLRFILRYLLHNEQLIERLSQSYPIRRAAQLFFYVYSRGRAIGAEGLGGKAAEEGGRRVQGFTTRFKEELKKGIEEFNEEMKKKSK